MPSVSILVTGRVQGVWYRASAREEALRLGIRGYIKNLEDGSVYIEASAAEPVLGQFICWCLCGPPRAKPQQVNIKPLPDMDFEGFEIRYN